MARTREGRRKSPRTPARRRERGGHQRPTTESKAAVRFTAELDRHLGANEGQSPASVDDQCAVANPITNPTGLGICWEKLCVQPKHTSIVGRDGGYTTGVGKDVLWLYGDTIAPGSGGVIPCTGAVGSVDAPCVLEDNVDAKGRPQQLIPYTRDEVRESASLAKQNKRIALWPLGAVATSSNSADVAFLKVIVETIMVGRKPEAVFHEQGTGIATIRIRKPGSKPRLQGQRGKALVFTAAEPRWKPTFVGKEDGRRWRGPSDGTPYVFLYTWKSLETPVVLEAKLARVPVGRMSDRRAYEFYDGSAKRFVKSMARATRVAPYNLNVVAYNAFLGKFVSTHFGTFFGPRALFLRTAAEPYGPWSEPTMILLGAPPDGVSSFYNWHPAYGDEQTFILSFMTGKAGLFNTEFWLYRMTLHKEATLLVEPSQSAMVGEVPAIRFAASSHTTQHSARLRAEAPATRSSGNRRQAELREP